MAVVGVGAINSAINRCRRGAGRRASSMPVRRCIAGESYGPPQHRRGHLWVAPLGFGPPTFPAARGIISYAGQLKYAGRTFDARIELEGVGQRSTCL